MRTNPPGCTPAVEFYWDVASPYTYLAHTRLEQIAQAAGAEVFLKPVSLRHILAATNNQIPAACFNKSRYITRDIERWRELYNIPMKLPFYEVRFPIDTQLAMCGAMLAAEHGEALTYLRCMMQAYWVQGLRIDKAGVYIEVLRSYRGFHEGRFAECLIDALHPHSLDPDRVAELYRLSDEAVARGCFGLPSFVVNQELFFGNDRIDMLNAYLRERRGGIC